MNHLHYDSGRQLLATVSQDNIIKLWNIKEMLEAAIMTGPWHEDIVTSLEEVDTETSRQSVKPRISFLR